MSSLRNIEEKIDAGCANDEDRALRVNRLQELDGLEKLESMDLVQKARVKWEVEGDENSKFFHDIINSRRKSQMIQGIMHEGVWITKPNAIKLAFLNFYKDKFNCHDSPIIFPLMSAVKFLSDEDRNFLDSMVSLEEIRAAISDCGSQKVSGQDDFLFMFVKKFWDLLKHDIQTFVVNFFISCTFPQGSNSAFITLIPKVSNPLYIKDYRPISLIGVHYKIVSKILANRLSKVIDSIISHEQSAFISGRQILDGPLILSEVIDWYKKRKKKMMLFKVDFEKAFDSVSWRFLDHVLEKLGFGVKWHGWIKAGLVSAQTSILLNGSPTSEFSLKRGLRQGDPLSPFLFIIVMEGLHIALRDGLAANMFRGVKVGSPGSNMGRIINWKVLIDRFKDRLSGWKANLLFIGGRLTLIKSVIGSLGIYYLSIFKAPEAVIKALESLRALFFWGAFEDKKKLAWIKWSNILASFDKGGLCVAGANLACNQALGWHLEEIHVTWAYLEKKRTRLLTCTKIHQEVLFSERGDSVAGIKRHHHDLSGDGVWILATAS
ncbi:putative RNA-directed DNA polymerase, eukaryota, reverse transcriptase zinc-binding domain protein [Tanacetum coccineum]